MATLQDLMFSFFGKSQAGQVPTAANVVNGFQSVTASTGATTLVTVPAGRTWVGKIGASCAVGNAAASLVAGQAKALFSVAGAGAVPTGNVFAVNAQVGANAATGTVGDGANAFNQTDLTVVAPTGNSVTIQVTTTIAGSAGECDSYAIGQLI